MRTLPRLRSGGGGLTLIIALMMGSAHSMAADTPLAKYVASEDLAVYFQCEGLDAHADAWSKTAAHAVLNDTTAGAMLEKLASQLAEVVLSNTPTRPVSGAELAQIGTHLMKKGFALAYHGRLSAEGESDLTVTVVFRGTGAGELKEPFESLLRAAIPPNAQTQILTRQDGRKLVVVRPGNDQPGWVFWTENDDVVLVAGKGEFGADPVIAALEGQRPSLADDPRIAELSAKTDGFEPVAIGFLDPEALPPAPPEFGLDDLERIDLRYGFQGKDLVSITRVLAPKPRKGVLSAFDQPPITAQNFPPIPSGVHAYTVGSLDLAKLYDLGTSLFLQENPDGKAMLEGVNGTFTQMTGLKLRDEVLSHLGPRFAFYVVPRTVQAPLTPFNGIADWLFHMPPIVVLASTDDASALGKTLDAFQKTLNGLLASTASGDSGPMELKTTEAPERGWRLHVPPRVFPLPPIIKPGMILGSKYLALSTHLDGAREAIALEDNAAATIKPANLPAGLVYYDVTDPRDLMPDLIANLPFAFQMMGRMGPNGPFQPVDPQFNPLATIEIDPDLVPSARAMSQKMYPNTIAVTVDDRGLTITTRESFPTINPASAFPFLVGTMLPAVSSARQAARRTQSVNNMKQIGLGMHNYHAVHGEFPSDICDADGKLLLSWRVRILPFIEQQALYNQFHLDEPWDSEHNKPLSEYMIPTYTTPTTNPVPVGHTFYQGFVAEGAFFNKCEGTKIQDITDGTSNTIMCVEAGKAVPWSKPGDLPYDPEKPLPKLGGPGFSGGFNALFADGSVHFLKNTVAEETLRALITKNGGEVVSADSF